MSLSPIESRQAISRIAASLCGQEVIDVRVCGGGANNRVYRIQTLDQTFALKSYGTKALGDRDRLGHEYEGLKFLKARGIGTELPATIAVDREARCALYEWIDGTPPLEHGPEDVSALLDLLAKMHEASQVPAAMAIPFATEAVLRLSDLIEQINGRFARLKGVLEAEPELAEFLHRDLIPETRRRMCVLRDRDLNVRLPANKRTLSPSDFGFHNALRRPNGSLCFIDFEYFGWDDPVKLSADFLWHPAMDLSQAECEGYIKGVLRLFGDDPDYRPRLAACYPLYGVRWILIILNEFLPQMWARRTFSGKGGAWEGAKRAQLRKARAKLATLKAYPEGHSIP